MISIQKNIIINADDKVKDVTINFYKPNKEKIFKKRDILTKYKGYIWSKNSRFIDDENIAYINNRPYFSNQKMDEYIGVTNTTTLKNKIIMKTKGNNLSFGKVNHKGIVVITDKGNYILSALGDLIK